MEIYAGFLEHTDHHIGRLVDALRDLQVLGDTLVMYILGDNGASAEGTLNGSFNEMTMMNGMAAIETVEFMKSRINDFGGPNAKALEATVGATLSWQASTNRGALVRREA